LACNDRVPINLYHKPVSSPVQSPQRGAGSLLAISSDQAKEEMMSDSVLAVGQTPTELYRSTRIGAGLGAAVAAVNVVWSLVVLFKNSNALVAHGSWMLNLVLSVVYLAFAARFFLGDRTMQQRMNCGLISLMYALAMGIAVVGVIMMPKLKMSVVMVLVPFIVHFFAFALLLWDTSDQESRS
jgi:hypothetical protein